MAMMRKVCPECGVTCWHNPKKEGWRCTFCGFPAGGNTGTPKKDLNTQIVKTQGAKARLLGIKEV